MVMAVMMVMIDVGADGSGVGGVGDNGIGSGNDVDCNDDTIKVGADRMELAVW